MLTSFIASVRSSISSLSRSSGAEAGDTTSIDLAGRGDPGVTRVQARRRRRGRQRILAATAVVAVGAIVGTGFVVQSNAAAENDRLAAAEVAAHDEKEATQLRADQVRVHISLATAYAQKSAEAAVADGTTVLAAAAGKTDATALAASVASLADSTPIVPDRIVQLASQTRAQTASVRAATAEVDRVASEQAQAAAAAAAAAEAAAADAAAKAKAAEKAAAAAEAAKQPAAPSRPSAPTDPSGAQAIARDLMMSQYGWGGDQFGCLVSLWNKESGWNVNAYNASSGATGIPQALPGNKMASAGADWQTNPATQITWGLGYIAGRYGTPCAAWDQSESVGWY